MAQVRSGIQLDDDELGGSEVDMDEDPAPVDDNPQGSAENPVPPIEEFGVVQPKKPVEEVDKPAGYPMELSQRPLLLLPSMVQVSLDMPALVSPVRVKGLLRGDFGASDKVQVGVLYGPGALTEDGFYPGKGASLEVRYRVFDWLSAQASLPMWFDPFSIGITLGAPMKFRFGDKLAFIGGQDFLNVRLWRFVPAVGDPLYNEAQVALDAVNTTLSRGDLRFLGGVIYQISPRLAFTGEIGILAFDFALTDAGVPLLGSLTWSRDSKVDLGVRVGFENLDKAAETFGAAVTFALRI